MNERRREAAPAVRERDERREAAAVAGAPPAERVLALQRTAGNWAVSRALARQSMDGGVATDAGVDEQLDGGSPPGGVADVAVDDSTIRGQIRAVQAQVGQQQAQPAPPPPTQDEIVAASLRALVSSYQNIQVTAPGVDPNPPRRRRGAPQPQAAAADPAAAGAAAAPAPAPAPTTITVRTPYWINTAGRRTARRTATARASSAERRIFGAFPSEVRLGKGSPDQIQAALQQALDAGVIRGARNGWPPTAAEVQGWMDRWGIGVDCSGFVYHALEAADAALAGAGMAHLSTADRDMQATLGGTVGNVGSAGLRSSRHAPGTAVTSPSDLRVGDIVYLAPGSPAVGHIRMIDSVNVTATHVVYTTAESTSSGSDGPQLTTWRLPVGGSMSVRNLETSTDGGTTWQAARRGRPTTYHRRLPTAAAGGAAAAPPAAPAVTRTIARTPRLARAWSNTDTRTTGSNPGSTITQNAPPTPAGGWNAGTQTVDGARRIPIEGITTGRDQPGRHSASTETVSDAGGHGRAIVVVPTTVTPTTTSVDVLLHFHGKNLGYRQRENDATVRDVALDRVEQQVQASAARNSRALVGILPQGDTNANFGAGGNRSFDTTAYIREVLGLLAPMIGMASAPAYGSLAIAGHSGGGYAEMDAIDAAVAQDRAAGGTGQGEISGHLREVIMFDAIHEQAGVNRVWAWMSRRLNHDKRELAAAATEADKLQYLQTSTRFFGYYTAGYYENNYAPLRALRNQWFANNARALGGRSSTVFEALSANYQIGPTRRASTARGNAHEGIIGSGNLEEALDGIAGPPPFGPSRRAPAAPRPAATVSPYPAGRSLARSAVLQRQNTPASPPAGQGAPAAADPLTAPLTAREWKGVDIWLSRGEVGIEPLTADPDHNAGVIAGAIFCDRMVGSPEFGEGDPLLCVIPEVTRADPRVQALKVHVNARGPIRHWPAVPRADRQSYVMNLLVTTHGYPVNGAAGIVGNLTAESDVLPSRIESSSSDTPMRAPAAGGGRQDFDPDEVMNRTTGANATGPRDPGIGLAQWTTPARRSGLFTGGSSILFDMDGQVRYLVGELQARARVQGVVSAAGVSVDAASDEVVYNFEIPGSVLSPGGGKRPRTDPQVIRVFEERRRLSHGALAAYQRFLETQAAAGGPATP